VKRLLGERDTGTLANEHYQGPTLADTDISKNEKKNIDLNVAHGRYKQAEKSRGQAPFDRHLLYDGKHHGILHARGRITTGASRRTVATDHAHGENHCAARITF
jgi:hypothetical protein